MRYDTTVTFISEAQRKYVPKKGYVGAETSFAKQANVTGLGIEHSVQLFGSITTDKKVIRLMEAIEAPWTYVKIDDVKYKLVSQLCTAKGQVLIVGETHE